MTGPLAPAPIFSSVSSSYWVSREGGGGVWCWLCVSCMSTAGGGGTSFIRVSYFFFWLVQVGRIYRQYYFHVICSVWPRASRLQPLLTYDTKDGHDVSPSETIRRRCIDQLCAWASGVRRREVRAEDPITASACLCVFLPTDYSSPDRKPKEPRDLLLWFEVHPHTTLFFLDHRSKSE